MAKALRMCPQEFSAVARLTHATLKLIGKLFSISFILCVPYGKDTAKHVDALRCSFIDPAEIFLEWSVIIKHFEDEKWKLTMTD